MSIRSGRKRAPEGKAAAPRAATLRCRLLAIFLRTGVSGLRRWTLSRQLLQPVWFRCVHCWGRAAGFCGAHGLGPAKYAQLQAVLEMGGAIWPNSCNGRGAHLARAYP